MNPSPLGNEPPKGGDPKEPLKLPKGASQGPKIGTNENFLPATYPQEHNGFKMLRTDN